MTTTTTPPSYVCFRCLQVPSEIGRPDYAEDGIPKGGNPPPAWVIEVKTEEDIAGMRAAGKVARCVLVPATFSAMSYS